METIFDDMFMEWKAEGKTQGHAEEIVSIYRGEGYPDQFILEKLQSKLNMAVDAAKEFLMNHGKQTA